ncbi:MAG: M24 family metallopeptidase [Candidatus Thorarchaeota archaeon]
MRVGRAKRIMVREEVTGIIIFDPLNIRYLTGYKPASITGTSVAILTQDAEPRLIVPEVESNFAETNSWVKNVNSYQPQGTEGFKSTILGGIKDAIDELKLRSLDMGVELDYISARRFEELKRLLPDAGFKNISGSMAELRMVKDDAEIEKIQASVQISENGLRAALEFIQPGISEIEVAAEVERTLRRAGATHTGYPTVIASGSRASYPFAAASRREIESNEFVIISVSAIYDDYCSTLTRTVLTGKPSDKHTNLFNCTRDAVVAAKRYLTSDTLVRDIALTIRRIANEYGYLRHLIPQMGNSIGLHPIENPLITVTEEIPFKPGMVFNLAAGFFVPELGGVRLSDMIVSNKDGSYKTLNEFPLQTV